MQHLDIIAINCNRVCNLFHSTVIGYLLHTFCENSIISQIVGLGNILPKRKAIAETVRRIIDD